MAHDPEIGLKISAEIIHIKGHCSACHQIGETFEISCHNPNGLCGFFYHAIFPNLKTLQFGGQLPWWKGDTIDVQCSDPVNTVTMRLTKSVRQ